jgi:hypothetical protein
MKPTAENDIRLRIVLESPPPGVDFGLQYGHGSDYQTVQTQRSKGKDLVFNFTVRVKSGRSMPSLLGPFVQGPTDGRFVYIDIGTYAGQTDTCWSRRLKVPLSGITGEIVDQLVRKPDALLETRVPGSGKDESPTCATVKPFAGWTIRR